MIKYFCDLCGEETTYSEHQGNTICLCRETTELYCRRKKLVVHVCDKCFKRYERKVKKEYKFDKKKEVQND